jgi:hypothetical protein
MLIRPAPVARATFRSSRRVAASTGSCVGHALRQPTALRRASRCPHGLSRAARAGYDLARHLLPTARVTSDGLACCASVTEAGCVPMPKVVGARKRHDSPEFEWVNTVLGNRKTMLAGTFKALD